MYGPIILKQLGGCGKRNVLEGQKDLAFIDANSLESCGIAIPSVATPTLDLVEAIDRPSSSDNDAICSKYLCSKELIWTSKRPTPQDNEATEVFIQIVISDDVQKKLIDKKTPKVKVWQMVYQKMKENSYIISNEIKDGDNKCFQKSRNLEKSYQNHKQRSFKTDNGFMKAPAQFDILHCFMESKYKINSPSIIDTLSIDKKTINTSSSISTVASLSPLYTSGSLNTSRLPTASATALFSDLSDDEELACMTMPSTSKISPPSILHRPKNTLKPINKTSIILDTLNR
ncbi:Uncharacterized protein FWK35_00021900 [Aphis craccivora]|uniref:Uncharacterized protein n=1 Tax=Aphis craccivora TaxID=307492 RepID=A0A6G0XJM2_APHCR|nr:Uncharacterized protein FWK35_00021900 [Aphis craccivora]